MMHLLDVNALLALVHEAHEHHGRAIEWLVSVQQKGRVAIATCAITELGFLRVSIQAGLLPDLAAAQAALAAFKGSATVETAFLSDGLGAERLPDYVEKPLQITDGHLLELAMSHKADLVTFDAGIPGAHLIK